MTDIVARVKQTAADLHLAAKLSNKPPLSAAFVFDDVVIALIAQAQEIERLNEKILQYEINSRDRMHIIAVQRAEAAEARVRAPQEAKPLSEWHEDIGPVLWWRFPVQEPPYVGTPLDAGRAVEVTIRDSVRDYKYTEHIGGWPGYHTHWTPLPDAPQEPQL